MTIEPRHFDPFSERNRRRVFAAVWVAVVVAVLWGFRSILVPFVLAVVIAYVLSPVVEWFSSRKIAGRPIQKWIVVVCLYVVMLASLGVGIRVVVPYVSDEVRDFARNEVPRITHDVRTRWLPRLRQVLQRYGGNAGRDESLRGAGAAGVSATSTDTESPDAPSAETSNGSVGAGRAGETIRVQRLPDGVVQIQLPRGGLSIEQEGNQIRIASGRRDVSQAFEAEALLERLRALGAGHATDIYRFSLGLVGGVVGGVFGFFITLMLSAYILLTEDRIVGFLRSLVRPESRRAFDELLRRIDRGLSGVVRGQLIICGVNGVLSAVGFGLAGLKYWPVLALVAAVFSLIPIFGAILSSVPAVIIGLGQGWGTGLFVLVWIIGIHQLEANLLNPKIMGDAAKIHPVLVVFSLLAGEHFFGILGALLAVPAMSLLQSIFLHWRKYALNYGDPQVAVDSLTSLPPIPAPPDIAHDAGAVHRNVKRPSEPPPPEKDP